MNENAPKRYIGLTGGIGSGKSTVARSFARLGARVMDADAISRKALDPGTECFEKTVARFGTEILRPDGTVDRKFLASVVFADDAARNDLNAIIHPYVRETMLREAEQTPENTLVVFDVPLLFESRMEGIAHLTVCVVTDDAERVKRVMRRDGSDEKAVYARIGAQMPQAEKAALSDVVIINNGNERELAEKTEALFAWLKERALPTGAR